MPWVAAAIAAGAAVGNIMSNMSAAEREALLQDQAFREYLAIKIPDPAQQRVALQRLAVQGTLTPELERAIQAKPSEFGKIVTSSIQKGAQNRALSELEQIGHSGGLRLQDKAALQDAQMQGQIQDRGNRAAIMDDMARAGQSGAGGMALQARLQGQQAVGDRNARSALSVAAGAQDRALQAIMGAGNMATEQRGQQFSEDSAKAQAADTIDMFNTKNLQDVNTRNTALRNRAQEMNLGERQRVADANVGIGNDEQKYNKNLIQQQYENQMAMANAKAGVYTGMGNSAIRNGQNQGNAWTNIGNAGAGAYTAYDSNNRQDARAQADRDFYAEYMKKRGS